jgi:hypothetical protein
MPSAPSPTRAAANRSGRSWAEQLLQRLDLGGQAAQRGPGAVRAGGHRARHGLHVDVAQVFQGQPEPVQAGVEFPQPGARAHGDQPGPGVRGHDAGPAGQIQRHPRRDRDRRERVPAADRVHP